jgi:hypothetical protein
VRWCYVILLTMTDDEEGTIAEDGELFTVEEIADRARLEVEEVKEAIKLLERHQFLEKDQSGKGWAVTNFYQFQVSRDAHRKRVQRHLVDNSRDKVNVKSKDKKKDKSQDESRSTRTDEEAEAEAEAEVEAEAEAEAEKTHLERKRFQPPTHEEVAEYVAAKGLEVVPHVFIDFYESKGWVVGKASMKDWRAACRRSQDWDQMPAHFLRLKKKMLPGDAGYYDDGEWMYGTFRRTDQNNFGNHSMWDDYTEEATKMPPMTAPPFEEWLQGQMEA